LMSRRKPRRIWSGEKAKEDKREHNRKEGGGAVLLSEFCPIRKNSGERRLRGSDIFGGGELERGQNFRILSIEKKRRAMTQKTEIAS